MSFSLLTTPVPQRRLLLELLVGATLLLGSVPGWSTGAPPAPPPAPVREYPPDPNEPTPPPTKVKAAPLPPADPAQVAQGKQLFKDYCQKCHGIDMASPGPPFFDLRTFPHDEKPRFVEAIVNGKRAMPAWGAIIKPGEIELLWSYVSAYKTP